MKDEAIGLLGVGSIEELKKERPGLIKTRPVSSRNGFGTRYNSSGII